MDASLSAVRETLEGERAQHLELLDEHGADPYSDRVKDLGVGNDGFADSGQATEERSEMLALLEQARTRVHQIDEALQRMEDGTYGRCAECGAEISAARLEVRPLSVRCVDCAG